MPRGGQPLRDAEGRRGPADAHGLLRAAREALHDRRDLRALGGERAGDDEDRVDLRLGGDRIERLRQEREGLRAERRGRRQIEGVGRGGHGDEERPQPLDARGAERGRAEPELRALVHRQDAVAAAERDHADAPAGRRPVAVPDQQERDVDELLDRVDADHAQLPEDGVDHAILADERTGVGLRRPGAGARRAGLDQDDGLPPIPRLLERADELPGVGGALEVAGDDVGARVPGERVEIVGVADDRLVPAADHVATAEARLLDERERRRADPAALGDDGDAPGPQHVHLEERGRERRGGGERRVDDADAVRAAEREPGLPAQGDEGPLELGARAARLAEPARVGDAVADARPGALPDRVEQRLRRHGQHGEVGDAGHLGDRRKGRQAGHGGGRPADGPHRSGESELDEPAHRVAAQVAGALRGPDHRDRRGLQDPGDVEERVVRPGRHRVHRAPADL